jgi:hypothetical protein
MQPYGNNATIGGPSALYTVFSVTRPAGKPCQNRIAPGEPRGWHGQLLFRLFYGQSASKKNSSQRGQQGNLRQRRRAFDEMTGPSGVLPKYGGWARRNLAHHAGAEAARGRAVVSPGRRHLRCPSARPRSRAADPLRHHSASSGRRRVGSAVARPDTAGTRPERLPLRRLSRSRIHSHRSGSRGPDAAQ